MGHATPEFRRPPTTPPKPLAAKAPRELVELILKSKGIWEEMIDKAHA